MYFAFFILLSVFLHGKQTDGLYICLASYVISVRRTKSLLTASFRFHLTMDTLAVQLYISHYLGMFRTFTCESAPMARKRNVRRRAHVWEGCPVLGRTFSISFSNSISGRRMSENVRHLSGAQKEPCFGASQPR